MFAHIFHLLVFDAGTFSLSCSLFHFATMLAEFLVFVLVDRASTLCIFCQKTMYHQVGIPTNRRSEVRIIVKRQSIVSHIVGAVFGFHHGTQGNHLYHVLFPLAFHLCKHLVQVSAHFALRAVRPQFVAELTNKIRQVHQFGRIG